MSDDGNGTMDKNQQNETDGKRTVVVGITGSIAAYKAAALTSELTKAGVNVHVVMTPSATKLVQPQTFLTISRNRVVTDLWEVPEWEPQHIALADHADMAVVAPATANILGKYAHGVADEALSTLLMAFEGPVLFAPAMNPRMWRTPAVQDNVDLLKRRNCHFVGPAEGDVACRNEHTSEAGRMVEPEEVTDATLVRLAAGRDSPLPQAARKKILITAGPTREHMDPVRFISNPSSGKMGFALAQAAAVFGHEVTLVSGPTNLTPPAGCVFKTVTSASEMNDVVTKSASSADMIIMSAAVTDFAPANVSEEKERKASFGSHVDVTPTVDIAATLGEQRTANQTLVGFAAETENPVSKARAKLEEKNLDWIVANDIAASDTGFAHDENRAVLVSRDDEIEFPKMLKVELAACLLETLLTP